jgi:hypothetical protein
MAPEIVSKGGKSAASERRKARPRIHGKHQRLDQRRSALEDFATLP